MKIIQMKVNHMENPMGFHMDKPVFSYKVGEAMGKKQTEARICVSLGADMKNLIYDSGYRSDIDSIAYEVPMELKACTRYYWNVCVCTDWPGESAVSETAWFETGKMQEVWEGKWIYSDLNTGNHPVFYKEFTVNKEVQTARLYICGLGLYEAYINETKVSDECLTPYCNAYDQWLQYQSFDITEMLRQNQDNLIEVALGDGWYKGRFGLSGSKGTYGDTLLLMGELSITYADGSREIIASDDSWKAKRSKITFSNIYDGEELDERFVDPAIYMVYLYQKEMPDLSARFSPAVRIMERRKPVELIKSPKGETILDMGQNMAGWFTFKVNEPAGTQITLSFFEILQEGCYYRDNLRTAKQEYRYISNGTPSVIRPHFTYYGYRYVKIEGVSHLRMEDFTGDVLYSHLEQTGTLVTGDTLVNRLILNALWGQKGNFIDVPTDCPQRDERLGWTGDAQVFSATACFHMDCYSFYQKYLHDMYVEQKAKQGLVPNFIPSMKEAQCSSVWGDAATIIPWNMYLFYGDKKILENQYESMKSWVDYITKENGDNWDWRTHYHWGDWLALDGQAGSAYGKTDAGYIAVVYYYHSAILVAKAAAIIGRKEDSDAYEALAAVIRQEIQDEYFSKHGRLTIDTQTGYILALYYNLAPDRERMIKDFKYRLSADGDKLKTGFVGTPLLCNTLSENGLNEQAYSLLLEEGFPGWLYAVKMGATTIWERWDSVMPDGSMNPQGMNSLNHYSYGSIVEWMYRHVAGMNPIEECPGFRKVKLSPKPDYRLGSTEASFNSPVGIYKSKWNIQSDGKLVLEIVVPFGGCATLTIPYAPESITDSYGLVTRTKEGYVTELEAGSYSFEYEPTVPMRKVYSLESTIEELMEDEKIRKVVTETLPFIDTLPREAYRATIPLLSKAMSNMIDAQQLSELEERLKQI